MGMTMTQKILARHAGLEHVVPGQLVEGKLDLVLGNDITTPVAIAEFNKAGLTQVFDREKIALVLDHYTPCKDIKAAQLCAQVREFAKRFDITHFYDVGCMGVEHALLPEQGLTAPGEAMIGADSHTCTYGAVNMFSTGVGSTDMAAGMATGLAWFRIPSAIKVTLKGQTPALCIRQGRDPPPYRHHRRGRRPLQVPGVRRGGGSLPVHGRPLHHRQHGH